MSPIGEALLEARDALPRVGESEGVYCMIRGHHLRALIDAAEAPPAAQPLSDEQIETLANAAWEEVLHRSDGDWSVTFAHAIEAAHGIKL